MRGRKPKPTKIHELNGNPSRINFKRDRAGEPKPRSAAPKCPSHLDAEAKTEWRRMVKELEAIGLLTLLDRAALAAYCQAWSRWVAAEANVQKFGPVLSQVVPAVFYRDGSQKSAEETKLYANPYVRIANTALAQMRAFLVEFGMTPSSRTRLSVSKPDTEKDALSTFLGETG